MKIEMLEMSCDELVSYPYFSMYRFRLTAYSDFGKDWIKKGDWVYENRKV